jgi:nucleoid-associated protein YgaU
VALLAAAIVVVASAAAVVPRGARAVDPVTGSGGDGAVLVAEPALIQHVVVPGDTVWALAERVDPNADPREVTDRILRLNGMSGPALQVGETVILPRVR